MITNKLKINDSKTEFIVLRSPQLRYDLSGLSVNVGESKITQSSMVRDWGVIFDNCSTLKIILPLYVEAHFYKENNINLLSHDICSTIIHTLISSIRLL